MDIDEGYDDVPGRTISLRLNDQPRTLRIEDRQLLVAVIREAADLTGTHVGCYGGDCGACTVEIDGRITKSCLVLAASVDGCEITTIEGIGGTDGLDEIQLAFWEADAFQCGFCLPGHLFAVRDLLRRTSDPSEDDVRDALIGNICRCTGYVTIVDAALDAARRMEAKTRTAD
jgi:aerobic-type carbon monoxide dehydrogenase small subunit (CoxS/CutS family)